MVVGVRSGLVLSALSLLCCAAPADVVGELDYGRRVERIETLGRYSSDETALLLQLAGARETISVEHDFSLYRVTYPTVGVHGGTTTVSGLVAVPATVNIRGIVSWQHGTNSYRPNSISKPSLPEGLGVSALFASAGFIVVAADYIGLGVSTEPHPYYHWPSTVSTVVDLLSIAKIMLEGLASEPDRDLYLAGFSQGGGATAALQRALQNENPTRLRLRGAATVSAAFNPREISFAHFMKREELFFLAMVLPAFAYAYDQSLDEVVQKPYSDRLADWFDGTRNQDALTQMLPKDISQFFTPAFLEAYEKGEEYPRWFYDALRAAATDDYTPEAPLRIYVGSEDVTVVPKEGRAAFAVMRERGGSVELVETGPYTHDEMVVHSLPSIQQWFLQLDGRRR